jgi:uncharacterized repeat protein (TIGR03803 family)
MHIQSVSSFFYAIAVFTAFTLGAAVSSQAQTQSVLYAFTGQSDGASPQAGLTRDAAGNLYGIAGDAVFELSPISGGGFTFNTIFTLTDGRSPLSSLVFDAAGNLYGSTALGGTGLCDRGQGCGLIFELSPVSGSWVETVLYNFTGGSDGAAPSGNLVFDSAGNLYGTTGSGGYLPCGTGQGCGTVFKLSPASGGWTESVVYAFRDGIDGGFPLGGVIADAAGNLYGTASKGGALNIEDCGCGVVFSLAHTSATTWTKSVIHRFTGGADGSHPSGGLTLDAKGNLYGTSEEGGTHSFGTVFRLSPPHVGGRAFFLLHTFAFTDGSMPGSSLAIDAVGNLFGTTVEGGNAPHGGIGFGVVFKLSPKANGTWTDTTLYKFTDGSDGGAPSGNLVLDGSGNVFGVTETGGNPTDCSGIGCGVVYQIAP